MGGMGIVSEAESLPLRIIWLDDGRHLLTTGMRAHLWDIAAGAAIIKARGASSAASAANAAIDTVRSLSSETPADDWHSVAVCSEGQYDIDPGLIASMPIRSDGAGGWSVVEGLEIEDYSRGLIGASVRELREEREAVRDLIPGSSP